MATKLKFLNQFQKFDLDAFLKDKTIIVNGISQWKEFGSDKVAGTKIEVVIMKDGTKYVQKEKETKFWFLVLLTSTVQINKFIILY